MVSEARQGRVIVLTGDGKGKTTSALGMALRAVGSGLTVLMVQFIKAARTGEHEAAARLAPDFEIRQAGRGFLPPHGDVPLAEHRRAARDGLALVRDFLEGRRWDMVIADELLTAVALELVMVEEALALLEARPEDVHLVLTGRGAPEEVLARADLVTEMRCVRHPCGEGAGPERGIEF